MVSAKKVEVLMNFFKLQDSMEPIFRMPDIMTCCRLYQPTQTWLVSEIDDIASWSYPSFLPEWIQEIQVIPLTKLPSKIERL
jgi:hypothetical protein